MNAISIALLWCAAQVTLIGLLSAGLYVAVRRFRPAAAATVVLAGLAMVVMLSLLSQSPWPRWAIGSPLLTILRSVPGEGQGLRAAESQVSPRPLAGEGPGVRASDFDFTSEPLAHEGARLETDEPHHTPASNEPATEPFWHTLKDQLVRACSYSVADDARWPAVVAAIMLAAMAAGLTWLMVGVLAVRWQVQRSRPVMDAELLSLVDQLRAELHCRRPVAVRQSDDLSTAATIGWRRPVLLLPPDWQTWTQEQRRAILAHEIAHARSQDFLALLFGQLGLTLHFYHPLLHWMMNRLRLEQELAADAAAANVTGGQSACLTTIAELALRRQDRPLLWPARAFLPTQTTFLRRIAMLRDSNLRFDRPSGHLRWLTVGVVLLCGLLVAGLKGPDVSSCALADDQQQPHTTASDEGPAKTAPDELKPAFEVRLPSGIAVELLGVSENPSKGRHWWRPDGSPLAQRPYESLGESVVAGKDEVVYELAVRLGNLPSEPVGTTWQFDLGATLPFGWGHGNPRRYFDTGTNPVRAISLRAPAATKSVTVRFAVAAGSWNTKVERDQRERSLRILVSSIDRGVVFAEPIDRADNTVVVQVAYATVDGEKRVIAVDDKGQDHVASSLISGVAGDVSQLTAVFSNLPLKQIRQFCFQTRPYQWVEFHNVSLQPGKKTDVRVVHPDTPKSRAHEPALDKPTKSDVKKPITGQ